MRGSRAAGGVLSSGAPAQAGRRRRRRAGASAQKGRPGRRAGPLCEQGLARGKQVHFVACAPAGGGCGPARNRKRDLSEIGLRNTPPPQYLSAIPKKPNCGPFLAICGYFLANCGAPGCNATPPGGYCIAVRCAGIGPGGYFRDPRAPADRAGRETLGGGGAGGQAAGGRNRAAGGGRAGRRRGGPSCARGRPRAKPAGAACRRSLRNGGGDLGPNGRFSDGRGGRKGRSKAQRGLKGHTGAPMWEHFRGPPSHPEVNFAPPFPHPHFGANSCLRWCMCRHFSAATTLRCRAVRACGCGSARRVR